MLFVSYCFCDMYNRTQKYIMTRLKKKKEVHASVGLENPLTGSYPDQGELLMLSLYNYRVSGVACLRFLPL